MWQVDWQLVILHPALHILIYPQVRSRNALATWLLHHRLIALMRLAFIFNRASLELGFSSKSFDRLPAFPLFKSSALGKIIYARGDL